MTKLIRRLAWFAAGAIGLMAATVASIYAIQHRASRDLANAREFSRLGRTAAALATDRETGIRGFLLTHNKASLYPDVIGRERLPRLFDSLNTLTRNRPDEAARVRAAEAAISKWDAEFAAPAIAGTLAADPETMVGKTLFDGVRSRFDELIGAAEIEFRQESSRVRSIELASEIALLLELALVLGALLFFMRRRLLAQAADLARQQELLEHQAVELELQMAELQATNESLAEREETLRRSDERYRYAAKATTDAIYDWDVASNHFEWNEGIRGLFGYPDEEIGTTIEWIVGLLHPEDTDRVMDTFYAAFGPGGGTKWKCEYRLRRKDGKYSKAEGRAHFIRGTDGSTVRVIGAISDRTQQQSLEDQLRQSQKMEAVGRLAGGIAHDFNNILTVMRMSSEFLLADLPEADERRSEAVEIMKAADRAAALTRQLLTFSRHQVLNPRLVVINDVISGLDGMLRRVVPENIKVTTSLDQQIYGIKADSGQLEQVILNLAINAADAMPDGGCLDLRTSNAEVDSAFSAAHLGVDPGSYVCLTVSDTGHGMDKETAAKIFDPFFTTKPLGKGTGLGLATVHGIVAQSGGKIWVYSEPGQGTTFKIFIPRSEGTVTPLIPQTVRKLAPPTETILLVEDEESTRDAVHRSLVRAGYKVLIATNGSEALAIANANNGEIALVLSDTMMPEMGGIELARRLRKARPQVRVLLMSGYTEEMPSLGFRSVDLPFIEKPFAAVDLLAAIDAALHPHPEEPERAAS
jgi:PAS domain S-box-containing protein